jgi:hypothetical protein
VKERLEAALKQVQQLRAQRDEIDEMVRREAIKRGYLRWRRTPLRRDG